MLPELSPVSLAVGPTETLVAVTGVAGGDPPATVVIEYCCPEATAAPANNNTEVLHTNLPET